VVDAITGLGTTHFEVDNWGIDILIGGSQKAVMIPPGAQMVSDPVDLNVPPLSDLAISVYIPGDSGPLTTHGTALHTTYISQAGDSAGAPAPSFLKRATP